MIFAARQILKAPPTRCVQFLPFETCSKSNWGDIILLIGRQHFMKMETRYCSCIHLVTYFCRYSPSKHFQVVWYNYKSVIIVDRFPPTTLMLRGDQCWMLLRSQVSTASGSWMRQLQVGMRNFGIDGRFLQVFKFFFGSRSSIIDNILPFSLQLRWHMGSINRIFLLLRRKRGMLSLWTWAILDTKHQCVPLIRANSRCEEMTVNTLNMCYRLI